MRSGPGRSRKNSKSRGPSGHSTMSRCSSAVKPEVTKSWGAPASSMVAMAPKRAPVSARALSTTSFSTISRSRLALMRRLAALSARCGRAAPRSRPPPARDRASRLLLPPAARRRVIRPRPARRDSGQGVLRLVFRIIRAVFAKLTYVRTLLSHIVCHNYKVNCVRTAGEAGQVRGVETEMNCASEPADLRLEVGSNRPPTMPRDRCERQTLTARTARCRDRAVRGGLRVPGEPARAFSQVPSVEPAAADGDELTRLPPAVETGPASTPQGRRTPRR